MSVERTGSKFLLALVSGAVLSACSPSASTAVPPVDAAVSAAITPVAAQAVAIPPAAAAPVQPLVTGLPDFTRLVDAYGPAVVNVRVQAKARARGAQQRINPFERFGFEIPGMPDPREEGPRSGEGSGFIVTHDGYIMTNAHVVKGADEVVVTLQNRRELDAKVVGFDERTDVAVIKVTANDLPTVKLGDPARLKPGQWVVAIGSPFGMQNSVTAGIVSATGRDLPSDGGNAAPPFIQTDAAVNPGNSGGPLFNLEGEVVGINSQIYSQSGGYMGLSFAIPIDIADNIRDQLVRTGRVTRSQIGVRIQSVSAQDADAFGLDRPRGALVGEVMKDTPAEKAGLQPGDIILSVDGRPIESNSSLPTIISTMRPGSDVSLELWRDKKLRKVSAKLVEAPGEEGGEREVRPSGPGRGAAPPSAEQSSLGLSIRPLTSDERRQVETSGSLVIEDVSGPAEDRLRPGDIILSVGGTDVKTVAELQAEVRKISGRNVPLRFQRGDVVGYATIRKQQ